MNLETITKELTTELEYMEVEAKRIRATLAVLEGSSKTLSPATTERRRVGRPLGSHNKHRSTQRLQTKAERKNKAPAYKMSTAARKKISLAQKKRWAKQKAAATPAYKMSKSARKKISLAQKARWAKQKEAVATVAATKAA
jgi:hypothetical protein